MAVYRFRIAFEEHEDVYREIEILGKQSYEDFHRAIQEAIGFDNTKDASFFMSDDLWRKGGQEIALKPPSNDDDDDDDYPRREKKDIRQMSKSRIADFIDDPHQKMIYVSDPVARWTLMIELVKILADDPKTRYPVCVKTIGAAPKQYKQAIIPPPIDEDEEEEEDDKKAPEKVFTAVETFDESEHTGDTEEGEEESAGIAEEGEANGEAEEEGSDFDPGSFGDKDAEEF
jgi:hypothetical protein